MSFIGLAKPLAFREDFSLFKSDDLINTPEIALLSVFAI